MFRVPKRFRMDSGVKFLDIVEDSLFGTLQRTGVSILSETAAVANSSASGMETPIMRLAR